MESNMQLDLANALKHARGSMTQQEVAEAMGTNQAIIARLESGRKNPTIATLERFAKATDTSLRIAFETKDGSR